MAERPPTFRLNTAHWFCKNLVFAGLGLMPGTTRYWDSSRDYAPGTGNHGTLTGYTGAGNLPVDRWGRVPELGRASLGFNGATDTVSTPVLMSTATFTFAMWCLGTSSYLDGSIAGEAGATPYKKLLFAPAGSSDGTKCHLYIGDGVDYDILTTAWPTAEAAKLHHYCVTRQAGQTPRFYIDGVEHAVTGTSTKTAIMAFSLTPLGYRPGDGSLADPFIWSGAKSPSEIAQLADREWSVMMGGAILAPRPRRNFVAFGGAPPEGNRRRRLIICGSAA